VSKRGVVILAVVALLGTWLFVVGYEFLEKENALWQQKVKAAKEDQRKCEARLSKFRNFDQFRTSIRLPYTSDLPVERWMQQYNTLRAGMSEAEVEIIMGAPDYVYCGTNKEGDKFMGAGWWYAIAVPQALGKDDQNSTIEVDFDPSGKLRDKSAVNMEPKPNPTPSPVQAATPASAATPAASPSPAAASPTATPAAQEPAATPAAPQATPATVATPSPTPQ
jgi:hypothetical protein